MKTKDHFLTKEEFEITPTPVEGILKTYPIPANLGKYYDSTDYISHHQDSQDLKTKIYRGLQRFNLNYKRNVIAGLLHKNAKVLDYGCGAGNFLNYIGSDFLTYGFEPNNKARASALKNSKAKIVDNIENIEDNSINAITLWHVLEHIDNPETTLQNFYRKLLKGGYLIIAVPNYKSFDALHYKEYWAAWDVPRHLYHYSKIGMENFLGKNQWKIVNIKPLLLDAYYISMISEKYQKSSLSWLKGMFYGTISNIKASKTGEFSSLIYIIEKI